MRTRKYQKGNETTDSGILKAVRAVGNRSELGRLLGVTPTAVRKWHLKGEVPPVRCPQVAKITGVPLAELNPIFAEVANEPKPR